MYDLGQPNANLQSDDVSFRPRRAVLPALFGFDEIEEIAQGGQAVIYRAIQRSTRRRVAVKVLRDGAFASRASLRRFEREVELVAGFRHPNILQIYDSGTTPDGHAYCVMEYVEGTAVDAHARRLFETLPPADAIREILRLFTQICEAVNYAHQRGVIHRDLKPGNLLVVDVGAGNSSPTGTEIMAASPRVLDFGLAKHDRLCATDMSQATETGYFLGSLQWASPEQIADSSIDIRSDVYTLGLTCYYALTQHFPYTVNGSLNTITESILRAPPMSPREFRGEIGPDLETVLLKCLTKSADDRYQTAGELKADLQRVLAGEPIAARRESGWQATRRTLARYRAIVIASGVALVLIVAFAIWMSLLYSRATRAELAALEESKRTAAESEKARAVTTFIESVLSSADPSKQGYRVTVVEALDRAAGEVRTSLQNQPEIEAAVESTLGQAYKNLGLNERASTHYRRAVDLLERLLGPNHPDVIDAIDRLTQTMVRNATVQTEAQVLLKRVLDARRMSLGPDHRKTKLTELNYYCHIGAHGLYPNALDDVNRLSSKCDETFGPTDELSMDFVLLHGRALVACGRLLEGERRYKEALSRLESHQDPEYRSRLAALADYGGLLTILGRDAEAVALFKRSLEVKQRVLGRGHPATLCTTTDMIPSLCNIGELDLAESLAAEALRFAENGGEEFSGVLFRTLFATGCVESARGRDESAHSQFEKGLDSYHRHFGQEFPGAYTSLVIENKLKTARIDALRLALAMAEQIESGFGAGDYRALQFRCQYGRALSAANRKREARDVLLKSAVELAKLLGENHPNVRLAQAELELLMKEDNP